MYPDTRPVLLTEGIEFLYRLFDLIALNFKVNLPGIVELEC